MKNTSSESSSTNVQMELSSLVNELKELRKEYSQLDKQLKKSKQSKYMEMMFKIIMYCYFNEGFRKYLTETIITLFENVLSMFH